MSSPDNAPPGSTRLRLLALALAIPETLYWLWTVSLAIRELGHPNADGFGMIPAFFSTLPFLAVTLPALLLASLGLAPRLALLLAVIGAILTPLIVWQTLFAGFLDSLAFALDTAVFAAQASR